MLALWGFILLLGLPSAPCSEAQFVWQLNHSFSLNTSASGPGLQLDATQPDLFFFPFEPQYSTLRNKSSPVFAYLCFVYFTPTPPNNTKQYTLSICLDSSETNHNGQPFQVAALVWTANRGTPLTGEVLSLTLQSDGDLVLQADNNHGQAWSSGTGNASHGVARMELILSDRVGANLVLFDSSNNSVWQSTENPSDTLTDLQFLVQNSTKQRLTSWASRTNTADGIYSLEVDPGGLALYASFPARMPYWMWIYDISCPATEASLMNVSCAKGGGLLSINLDSLGVNCWVASQGGGMVPYTCLVFASTGSDDLVNRTILKMYWDGNLRAHTLQYSASEDTHRVTLMDLFSLKQCSLPLRCGPFSICRGTSSPQCECPANSTLFLPVDASDSTQGCVHAQPLLGTCPNKANTVSNQSTSTTVTSQVMHRLEGLDYFFNAFSSPLPQFQTEEGCSNGCLQNCSCLAAFWYAHTLACYHVEQMGSLQAAINQSFIGFLKVNPSVVPSPEQNPDAFSSGSKKSNMSTGAIAAIVVATLAASLVLACSLFCIITRRRRRHAQTDDSEEAILDAIPGLPTRFSYAELHDITKGFSSKLGKGGFGAVYCGILPDGTKVAVKQLEGVNQGDKEFRSEVAIMAGIHHYNLLHLRGFCAQRAHRLLVYEYMENGSLDQWLFKRFSVSTDGNAEEQVAEKNSPLSWDLRFKIALGTARGLAYLHDECRERILHLDIKPQNILLDEEFVPKVADFGLSRPMDRDKSAVVTTMRGTPGYLAPEWLKEAGSIDVKCDVFSFGMLLLEVVSGRKNSDHSVKLPEQIYYPEWAYQQIVYSAQHKGLSIADELTDAKLESNKDRAQLMNVITTAFLCVVDKPEWRSSMAQVVKMLEAGEYEELAEASRTLQQRELQLVFVLMGKPDSSVSVGHASNTQSNTTTSSSN